MRLSILIYVFCLTYTTCAQSPVEITTDSDVGLSILAGSRQLEDNRGGGQNGQQSYKWMANYSLKYLGCHNVKAFNFDVDSDEDVRIQTGRLVRYRLCQTKYCSKSSGNGCSKGYGDYVVDIDTYVSAYVEAQRRQDEYECQNYMYKHCSCSYESDDTFDDAYTREMCEYQCFAKSNKWAHCIESNPYYDDDYASSSHLYRNDLRDFEGYFAGCSQFEPANNDRNLKDGNYYDTSYYIGSYCADQGGKIYLGMFTDDTCTVFADKNAGRTTYKKLTGGLELPFSDYSMVRNDCVSCNERDKHHNQNQNNGNRNYGNYNNEQIRVSDACKEVYAAAGKCETHMTSKSSSSSSSSSALNENGCYYIEGIRIVRKDGIIDTSLTRPNKVVSFFIFLFSVSFTLLGAFIYYLRMSKYQFITNNANPCIQERFHRLS